MNADTEGRARPHAAEFILYVADQARARDFYRHVLAAEPVLDVPGMTEFDLGGTTLGLMPAADMEALVSGQIRAGAGQRCELYLRRGDAAAALARAAEGGGRLLDGLRDRSWGECTGYLLDPDGHVLALAAAGPASESSGAELDGLDEQEQGGDDEVAAQGEHGDLERK